jgi:hypothetical protein
VELFAARKDIIYMRDLIIGFAFVAMLLTPAIVASFHRKRHDE